MTWPNTINVSIDCKQRILDSSIEAQLHHLNVLQLGYADAVDAFTIYRPNPEFHMMLFTTDGLGFLEVENQHFRLEPGSLMVVPAGIANGFSIGKDHWSLSWMMLPPTSQNRFTKLNKASIHISEYGTLLRHNIESLAIAFRSNSLNDQPLQRMLIEQCQHIIRQSVDQSAIANNMQMRLQHLTMVLTKQLHKPWTIEQMAERMHCSAPHLYRISQQWLQQTPMQHLQQLRLERAKQLLQFSENTMAQIAELVGFADLANFSRRFKVLAGQTPSQYRKHYREQRDQRQKKSVFKEVGKWQ